MIKGIRSNHQKTQQHKPFCVLWSRCSYQRASRAAPRGLLAIVFVNDTHYGPHCKDTLTFYIMIISRSTNRDRQIEPNTNHIPIFFFSRLSSSSSVKHTIIQSTHMCIAKQGCSGRDRWDTEFWEADASLKQKHMEKGPQCQANTCRQTGRGRGGTCSVCLHTSTASNSLCPSQIRDGILRYEV